MDEEEQNRYVVQLKEEFDSCDTTGTGYLDKEELTALCHKLHLDAHLPLLLDTLLGPHHYARVNFEEFKEGFVAVLSRSLDLSTSEEESSYLEPVVPEEVKPKFVKGTKRYGRRSRPDGPDSELTADSEETPPLRPEQAEPFPTGVRRAKLRRSTSLESVESLKSDEETGSNKEATHQTFEAQGQLKRWKRDALESPRRSPGPRADMEDGHMQAVCEELGVGGGGFLTRQELSVVCETLGLRDLRTEELDALFKRLDKDNDGRISLREFQKGLFKHGGVLAPTSSSTPIRSHPQQRSLSQAFEDSSVRSTSPSLLSATVGQRLLTRLDDGSGFTSPDRIITLWSDEGIRNSRDILQTLDFSLDEKLSLAELTLALDNELLVSGNGIHQAALISYKNEIQFLQVQVDQAGRERDKAKVDLDRAERRNLQLVREVEDRQATMESLNETKMRGLEQEYRDRLTALRSESEQESEVLLQQAEREKARLQQEVETLRAQDANLQEEIGTANQENIRLEKEVGQLKGKLSEAETTVSRLQRDLDQLLTDKFGGLDPHHTGMLSQEERFSQIIREYELQCRELRDRNDELNSELEMLKSQGAGRRSRRSRDSMFAHTWSSRRALTTESDSDDPEMKKSTSPLARKKLQVADKNGLGSLEALSGNMSIETELAVEQLKEKHSQEVQDLKIQLETKVNFYERSLELMRRNMELERKDISQDFKMEISELEEQKAQAEERAGRLQERVSELQAQLQAGAWGPDQERRVQRERAEMEQNYAREISNLVQRLTSERDQLEAELKLKMDQEVQRVREEAEQRQLQMEAQHAEARQALLQEQAEQHLREWEARELELLSESRRERLRSAERTAEEQARICSSAALERKRMEEEHEEEVRLLREQIRSLTAQARGAESRVGAELEEKHAQMEAELEEKYAQMEAELEEKCAQMEAELKSHVQQEAKLEETCVQLEVELEETCAQLEDCTASLRSQQALIRQLTTDLHTKEQELEKMNDRERKLICEQSQLRLEVSSVQAEFETLRKEKDMVQGNCSHLSTAFVQQQTQVQAKEEELDLLRKESVEVCENLKRKEEELLLQAAVLKSLEADKSKLLEELESQGSALERLQTQFESQAEDLDHARRKAQSFQDALREEEGKARQSSSTLDTEREERRRLAEENARYSRLSDQLSCQIMEMEAESAKLRENVQDLHQLLRQSEEVVLELRSQLEMKTKALDQLRMTEESRTALLESNEDLSVDHVRQINQLTAQLESKEEELSALRDKSENSTNQLQQALADAQADARRVEEEFHREKSRMKDQLLEMEQLVVTLEAVMDQASPQRTQLDEVTTENTALKDRIALLQQDVQRLEEEVDRKKKKLEELDKEHEKNREEVEKVYKENTKYREEVLELSARNLRLSGENAELSARLRADQGAVQLLTERLSQLTREQEEGASEARQLQEAASRQEREQLQLQASWQRERELLETELRTAKEKLQRLTDVEAELTSLTLKHQWLEQDKQRLVKEADERVQKMEQLQESLSSLSIQTEKLQSRLQTANVEKGLHAQEVTANQRMLQEAQDKIQELEASLGKLRREKEQLMQAQRHQEEERIQALQEECQSLRSQNQELLHKVDQLQVQQIEVQRVTQECLTLKNKQAHLETARLEAEDQLLQANTALTLVQSQHTREVQQLREQAGLGSREQLAHLQAQLAEEQRRGQQLEEQLRTQAQQASTQMILQQEQYEKSMNCMEEKLEEVEAKLKNLRMILQEKVNQLKEQLARNAKSDLLLKDLYVENSQLMKALQVTETRQKSAEKKNFLLEEKIVALNKLLRKIAPASLTT
ncbi:ninein-like protein [Megalops cyprinoides]|uniref:ninein-like protein n=1 Tax=Megalops cyprinoides TaxID=118141 RepID=UPI0018643130|nr:ninein-like protein [Megalops cyprinoides]